MKALRVVRKFLFGLFNKEFLTFLFFLALSAIFWLLIVLNETVETEIKVPVMVTHMPKETVISGLADTVRVTVKDKALFVFAAAYDKKRQPVMINFASHTKADGTGSMSSSELSKQLARIIPMVDRISAKPSELKFTYSKGRHKRVPVKVVGTIEPDKAYYLTRMQVKPDSVDVFVAVERLDSVTFVPTENVSFLDFSDTIRAKAKLQSIKDATVNPSEVELTLYTDVLTEESIDVPIQGVNVPEGKIIRTFPSKATVRFVTGVKNFRRIKASDFVVVVDYQDIESHPQEKCPIYLRTIPHGISRARLDNLTVDYLIESTDETKE